MIFNGNNVNWWRSVKLKNNTGKINVQSLSVSIYNIRYTPFQKDQKQLTWSYPLIILLFICIFFVQNNAAPNLERIININITYMYPSLAKQPVHSRKQMVRMIQRILNLCRIVREMEIHVTPRFNRRRGIANPSFCSVFYTLWIWISGCTFASILVSSSLLNLERPAKARCLAYFWYMNGASSRKPTNHKTRSSTTLFPSRGPVYL